MKKLIFIAIFILSFSIINNHLSASLAEHYIAPEPPKNTEIKPKVRRVQRNEPTESQLALIEQKATEYAVSAEVMTHIISHESDFVENAIGDINYVCPAGNRKGMISPSHGSVQISSCWHPHVTIEQANDFEFSVEFLAKGLASGKCKEWTTCRNLNLITMK